MRIALTGVSGFVGAALAPRLAADGHELHGITRAPDRVDPALPLAAVHRADAVSGTGLAYALRGAEVAYYLIHAMEPASGSDFETRDQRSAANFAAAAKAAGVRRIVYLGGPLPSGREPSRHLASRLAVEQTLLDAVPASVALRASIVIGARSRSFRVLVRLVERLTILVLPSWHRFRTQPIDERDAVAYLARAATATGVDGMALEIGGPEILSYGTMLERIAELMLVRRPAVRTTIGMTPVASVLAARVAGEEPELLRPLMESLSGDLVLDDHAARELLGVRLHSFDAAVERALREWEAHEPLRAR